MWQLGEGFEGRQGLQFWQVYFVTTPHRWITLGLVFFDRERFQRRQVAFVFIAAITIAVCLAVPISTGTLTCLLTVDYLWNAWHFAAQHHGIYRIYARQSQAERLAASATVEKWALRAFVLYTIVRVAGATWPYPNLERVLGAADWLLLAIPAWLVLRDCLEPAPSLGRRTYLASVLLLYSSLLLAAHANRPALVLSLTTATALFHATEYLALVTWSVQRRDAALPGRLGILGYLVPRWSFALAVFVLVLGASGWLLTQHWLQPWLLINVIVAFLHYAYDGMIWRRSGSG